MTTFTKLLPPEAAPAQPILARAKQLVLTSAQRMAWEDSFETPEGVIAVSVEEKRPLFVNDVFVDDAVYDLCPAKHRDGKKERGVNRLTVNTPKMHSSPHTYIKISIYILYYNKVRARGVSKKQLLTVNSVNPQT